MSARSGLARARRGLGRGLGGLHTRLSAGGAGESGLAGLTELTFVSAAGDALFTAVLASSTFLSVKPGEARGRIALYLLVTFAPFTVLAPVIGPVLDRFGNGRRLAMAVLNIARAVLLWMLAGALHDLRLYPIALGLLMLSRAFGVVRSAAVPRVLPPGMTLVAVNSRLSLVNVLAGVVAAPLGLGFAKIIGNAWLLRLGALVYVAAVVLSFRLPSLVDSAEGERSQRDLTRQATAAGGRSRVRRVIGALPTALRGAASLRALTGFLTLYLAFQLKSHTFDLGLLAASAGLGSGLGVFIGGRLSRRRPEWLIVVSLIAAAAVCVLATLHYTKASSLFAALVGTMAGSMAKLGLDAIIQRDIPWDVRTSSFARSETALQLAWVLGGAIGLIDMPGTVGFMVASIGMAAAIVMEVTGFRRTRRHRRAARFSAATDPGAAPRRAGDDPTVPRGAGVRDGNTVPESPAAFPSVDGA